MGIAIEVLPIGPVAVAARVFRHRGRRLFTAIVKATFTLVNDGPMVLAQPAPIVIEERHYRNNPVASLVRGSDIALLVPRPEIVVVGSAFAGPNQATPRTTVRLTVQRGEQIVLNKRLEVTGDRRARPGEPPPEPASFRQMPILYERAQGGIASRENPVGVGMAVDADGLLTLPNVASVGSTGPFPAGFGPIPSAWPVRQKKRGSLSWTAANLSPDVDVPNDFDDAYYQTAPPDQQTTELRAGDLVALVNMHPELGLLRTYLPSLRGVALAQTSTGDRIPLSLRIDTVHLEPDRMRAEIVYRGAAVIDEAMLIDLRLAGTVEAPDAPFSFPDLSTVAGLVARRADARDATPAPLESTAVFADPMVLEGRAALERALAPSSPPPPFGDRMGRAGTMVMEPEPEPRGFVPVPGTLRTTPPPGGGQQSSAPPPRPMSDPGFDDRRVSTLVIEPESAPQSLPFDKPPTSPAPTRSPSTPRAVNSGRTLTPEEISMLEGLEDVLSDAHAPASERPPPADPAHAKPHRAKLQEDAYKKIKR